MSLLYQNLPQQIWVDADACPNVIKEIRFRAAIRTRTLLILVANQLDRLLPTGKKTL